MLKPGNIVWANLGEYNDDFIQSGTRPCLVLSNAMACKHSPVISIAPISSKSAKAKKIPTHVLLNGFLKKDSYILPEQIRCIPKTAVLGESICTLPKEKMAEVSFAINKQFGLV